MYIYLILYILCKYVFKFKDYDISIVERILVLYMIFISFGYCFGISMWCMKLILMYKYIFYVFAL